jgi:LacI family transcriptional regulator, galactose operon repressor
MAGIRQIAKHLNVSVSTVSAVINQSGYVSDAMRARIEKALGEMNYQPNYVARSLRLKATHMIGLVVPDLTNTFYAHLMRGAESYLASLGYRLVVADSQEDWKRQQDYLLSFSAKTTDGIILVPSMASDKQIASIPHLLRETPLVYVDRSPLRCEVDSVLVDNSRAALEATQYLVGLGHRRIGIVTEPLNLLNAAERLQGYKRALRAHRIPLDTKLIRRGDNTEDSGYWRGLDLFKLADRPTAVVVCNNRMTLGVLAALREVGLACPRDISLVGFDDFDWSPFIEPPLTMVRQPAEELGASAARVVLKRIRHPEQDGFQKFLLPTQLVVRQSSAPCLNQRTERRS